MDDHNILQHAINAEHSLLAACKADDVACRDDHLDLILRYAQARDGALSVVETAAVVYTARSTYGEGA